MVEIDAASNRGVDDARDLRERAMYAASQAGHHKVYIVDEAHMLTREAWNALLKILEEPPPGVVFVFATTEPQKIAATAAPVLSRLQRFDFRRIGPAAIRARLRAVLDAEGIAADDDALTLIARHADGGMRDALSVLDQCLSLGEGAVTADRVREVLGLVGTSCSPRRSLSWPSETRPASSRSSTAWSMPGPIWSSSWAGPGRRSGPCSCSSLAPSRRGSPRGCARGWNATGSGSRRETWCGCSVSSPTARPRSAGAPTLAWWWRLSCCAGR